MITDKLLLEKGYKEYKSFWSYSDLSFQKKIRNEKGQTKYYINIHKYEHNDSPNKYEVDLQFEKDKYIMDIRLININEMTLEEIEIEVENIWCNLDCKYYDCRWNK